MPTIGIGESEYRFQLLEKDYLLESDGRTAKVELAGEGRTDVAYDPTDVAHDPTPYRTALLKRTNGVK
jgi:hypothetical protein